ncbi:efflux RND transporter periplasmic adaptor subunit [Endozoicomonas sp. G2_1]|nr:efflux RND transporter periplasmic adaptor subunit [Endozoicomonas sp. G2_1]
MTSYQDKVKRVGELSFKQTVSLSFKSSGYLMKLLVDEGDEFEQGDLLASLDTTELIADQKAKYAQLVQAKQNFNRARSLLDEGIGSQQAVDDTEALVNVSKAAYEISAYNIEKAKIIAAFNGVVLTKTAELGELQRPGQQLLRVAPLKDNWVVKVSLTQHEVGQIKLGQHVQVLLSNQKQFKGVISRIPAMADVTSNLFTVDILLAAIERPLGIVAGQLAHVEIDLNTKQLVYAVPVDALMSINHNGRALIMIEDKGKYSQQDYAVHSVDGHYLYLLAGDTVQPLNVVVTGWQRLQRGLK